MSNLLSSLVELHNVLELVFGGPIIRQEKLTKSGKPRKVSDRKGRPTANGDFVKMICKEKAEEYEAFKATQDTKRGAHFNFASSYKEKYPEAYPAFEAKWKLQQAEQAVQAIIAVSAKAPEAPKAPGPPKAAKAPEPPKAPKATPAIETKKKPVKTVKKAITTEVMAPIAVSIPDELLPFTIGEKTFLRLGTRRENGNHLWTSGHLWLSKKGAKGGHYGELRDDGSINMEADEPSC